LLVTNRPDQEAKEDHQAARADLVALGVRSLVTVVVVAVHQAPFLVGVEVVEDLQAFLREQVEVAEVVLKDRPMEVAEAVVLLRLLKTGVVVLLNLLKVEVVEVADLVMSY